MEHGLVKNARAVVMDISRFSVTVKVLLNNGSLSEEHSIPRISFKFKSPFAAYEVLRVQFPLRLAYASTFNSCLGLTLDKIVLDLRQDVFAHGQLYTAITRIRRRCDGRIFVPTPKLALTRNIVHSELLLPPPPPSLAPVAYHFLSII